MASVDIEKLLEQLESVAASPPDDPKLQQRLYDAAQKLSSAVEAPLDTVYRVIYSVRLRIPCWEDCTLGLTERFIQAHASKRCPDCDLYENIQHAGREWDTMHGGRAGQAYRGGRGIHRYVLRNPTILFSGFVKHAYLEC